MFLLPWQLSKTVNQSKLKLGVHSEKIMEAIIHKQTSPKTIPDRPQYIGYPQYSHATQHLVLFYFDRLNDSKKLPKVTRNREIWLKQGGNVGLTSV